MEYSFHYLYICSVNKKDSILLSALQLLAENGVHNTPMSAIGKAAGTGMGTIYNYFPNKEILINEIYVNIKKQEEEMFNYFSNEHPIKTQFENYYKTMCQFFIDNPMYFRFMEQLNASPIITEESHNFGLQAVDAVSQLIEKGKEERIFKNIESHEIMQFLGGSVFSYVGWYLRGDNQVNSSITNQLKMVWDAIKE